MKSSLKTVRVVHTQVIDKAKKLEIENINFINGGLAAEVSIIVDELEFYGCASGEMKLGVPQVSCPYRK